MNNKFKMYEIIIDDGTNVYKHHGVYKSEEEAREAATGNGEVIRIKDVTDDYPLPAAKIYTTLKNANFGDIEANAIYSFVSRLYANSL